VSVDIGMQGHIERHVGKAFEKTGYERCQENSPVRGIRYHTQRAGGRRMQLGNQHLRGIQLVDHPLGVRINELARGRQGNPAGRALEHSHAEGFLEVSDRAAHRGLRHAERTRGGGKPVEVDHFGENSKLRGCPEQVQVRAQCMDSVAALFHPGGASASLTQ